MHKRTGVPTVLTVCLLLSLAVSAQVRGRDMSLEFGDRPLFTQANLRILKTGGGEDVIAVNGRVDPNVDFIPLGRAARFIRQGIRGSVFEIDGKQYIVSHGRNLAYVQPDVAMRVRRVIDEMSPLPRLEALPENEQQMVREGKIGIGMSREAVLLSLGMPGNLNREQQAHVHGWKYHLRRFRGAMLIIFDDEWRIRSITMPEGMGDADVAVTGQALPNQDEPEQIDDPPEEYLKGKVLYAQTNLRALPRRGGYNVINIDGSFALDSLIIPAGTQAIFTAYDRGYLAFQVGDKEYHVRAYGAVHYDNPSETSRVLRLFAENDPKPQIEALLPNERALVAKARVEPGMSRRAVALALGYPANLNRAETRTANMWEYMWEREIMQVIFKDDKVLVVNNPPLY